MRRIVLDTETTGLSADKGHRIIEIGCVELDNRRLTGKTFHTYLQPDRDIDEGAKRVHGITEDFLKDKPRFKDIMHEFLLFIKDAELIIHNAPFDLSFLNMELLLQNPNAKNLESICPVIDTLLMAREKHPGLKNNLDALCKRYNVDNASRTYHGALLDAQILADVYLAMTGGQESLVLTHQNQTQIEDTEVSANFTKRAPLKILKASTLEIQAHLERLSLIEKEFGKTCLYNQLD